VRHLAKRTADATREINGMIEAIQTETRAVVDTMRAGTDQVERGVQVTSSAGESLRQIIEQAGAVGSMVTQIAAAATEQSAATEEVSSSMTEINRLVTGFSEQSQGSAKSCQHLTSLAQALRDMVGHFRLTDSPAPIRSPLASDRADWDPAVPAAIATSVSLPVAAR
jgi:methyl-accepting chemotaxis protein